MDTNKKWDILFIEDKESFFELNTDMFTKLFNKVDRAQGRDETLKLFDLYSYDMVVADLTVKPEELAFLKQLQDIKSEQSIFALVAPVDTDKLYGIADLGINAFELTPEQFELAMEEISKFDPYAVVEEDN